jgi:hypothetical protein
MVVIGAFRPSARLVGTEIYLLDDARVRRDFVVRLDQRATSRQKAATIASAGFRWIVEGR